MSTDQSPKVPTPLTAYGRHCRAEQLVRGSEAYQDHAALTLATALADEAPAAEIADKLYGFKWARECMSKWKAEAEVAEAEYYAEVDSRIADQKKMPPAVAAAESNENPNS